jgi:REP element-mobilizing transposase RayT
MENRYDNQFLERWIDKNHVHFLIHSVPSNSPKKIVSAVKSITTKEIFRLIPKAKLFLLGGKFWPSGYYVNSLARYANEEAIKKYFQNQGKWYYEKLHLNQL